MESQSFVEDTEKKQEIPFDYTYYYSVASQDKISLTTNMSFYMRLELTKIY